MDETYLSFRWLGDFAVSSAAIYRAYIPLLLDFSHGSDRNSIKKFPIGISCDMHRDHFAYRFLAKWNIDQDYGSKIDSGASSVMKALHLSWLVAKNFLDSFGIFQFFLKITVLDFLNYLTLAYLFQTESLSLGVVVYEKYPFFISLICFSAALSSWERDVVSATGKIFLMTDFFTVVFSRLLTVFFSSFVALGFFAFVILSNSGCLITDFINALFLSLATVLLGLGIGFTFGLREEKAINNTLHCSIWILALGSSFSKNNQNSFFNYLLPTNPSSSSLLLEVFKSSVIAFLGCMLVKRGLGMRKSLYLY